MVGQSPLLYDGLSAQSIKFMSSQMNPISPASPHIILGELISQEM